MAVAVSAGEIRSLGTIPNRSESVRKLIGKLGKADIQLNRTQMIRFLGGDNGDGSLERFQAASYDGTDGIVIVGFNYLTSQLWHCAKT